MQVDFVCWLFFGSWSFEEDPGCKSGDGEGGQDGCSGIDGALGDGCLSVVVASGVRMIVGGGGAGNSGSGYEWWGVLVRMVQELVNRNVAGSPSYEDLPYNIPFLNNIGCEFVFLVDLERKRW